MSVSNCKKKRKSRSTTTKDNQNIKQKDVTNGKEPRLPGPHTYLFFKTQADRWLFIVADNYLHCFPKCPKKKNIPVLTEYL